MKSETHEIFMEQPILHNNSLEYAVRGCVEKTEYSKHKGRITIENVSNDKAEFFGVYEIHNEDGSLIEHWISDFIHFDDALLFAQIKGRQP